MAENWARESEGEVSHLGNESESMLRKEPRLLPGDGCSSCSCLSVARACSLSAPASASPPLPREGGGLLGDNPGTWSGVRARGRVGVRVRGRDTGRVRGSGLGLGVRG